MTALDRTCGRRWWQVVAVAAVLGCHGLDAGDTLPSSGAAPSRRLCPFPAGEPVRRTLQWSLGCDELRQSAPPSIGGVAIWYADTRDPAPPPVRKVCLQGYSLLPSPDGKHVYVAGADELYVVNIEASPPRPEQVQVSMEPGWRFAALLAFEREAPETILALMRRVENLPDPSLWLIDIEDNRGTARRLAAGEVGRTVAKFFSRFTVPRCADGSERCLVVHRKDGEPDIVQVESSRGDLTSRLIQPLADESLRLLDAAWAEPQRQTVVLLAGDPACP